MATTADLLQDGYARIAQESRAVLSGLVPALLTYRIDPSANTIAWLIWHLTRIEDDHLAGAFGCGQVWIDDGWAARFALPFPDGVVGYGQKPAEVALVQPGADDLLGYFEAVHARSVDLLAGVRDADLDRVVDTRWDPPVTLAVRLVSVLSDGLQHVGQAAYVRGVAERLIRA
jgi:hypothetical protein